MIVSDFYYQSRLIVAFWAFLGRFLSKNLHLCLEISSLCVLYVQDLEKGEDICRRK